MEREKERFDCEEEEKKASNRFLHSFFRVDSENSVLNLSFNFQFDEHALFELSKLSKNKAFVNLTLSTAEN